MKAANVDKLNAIKQANEAKISASRAKAQYLKEQLAALPVKQAREAKEESDRQNKVMETLEHLFAEKLAKFNEIEAEKQRFMKETQDIIAAREMEEAERN